VNDVEFVSGSKAWSVRDAHSCTTDEAACMQSCHRCSSMSRHSLQAVEQMVCTHSWLTC